MLQSLAEAYPITIYYTCPSSGMRYRETFAGYPSYISRNAAASVWLLEMQQRCNYRGAYGDLY